MTMDNADMNRFAQDNGRLRIAPVREPGYTGTRPRPIHSSSLVRHADTVADDYGDDGYGYTNASDLVRYDLNNAQPTSHRSRSRRDSLDGGRAGGRPLSIGGYNDIAPRSYDARERGPPPSMRGFDKLHARAPSWDQGQGPVRMPVAPMPPPLPMSAIERPLAFEPIQPVKRSSTSRAYPTTMYHETRRAPRDDYYEAGDEESVQSRHRDRYEDNVEDRGFGIRTDRPDRIDQPHGRLARPDGDRDWIERSHNRAERPDRYDKSDRVERIERPERVDRHERSERPDNERSEYKRSDVLATSLSLAGAALGINAVKSAAREDREARDDREERDGRRHREKRDRDEREPVDMTDRDTKERRHRDGHSPPPREHMAPPREDRDGKRSPSQAEPADTTLRAERKEHQPSRDERDSDPERRERHRRGAEEVLTGTLTAAAVVDSRSDTSDDIPRSSRRRRESAAATPVFNPKDALDLKALKAELNAKEPLKVTPKEPESRTPRMSSTKDAREAADIRKELQEGDRRSREPLQSADNRQPRVVSPPREKVEEKPVKGILRVPKEKFPEDPSPIREGVAPLKDAKKDGIPPDARWTKISRKLVNPEALELGKERFEARDDFVIVLRVLSRDEVQGYAEVTQKLRANREELEEIEAQERRRKRRARHEEQKRERERNGDRDERERERRHHRRDRDSESSTDSEDGDRVIDRPKMLEAPPKRGARFEDAVMSGGLSADASARDMVSIPSRRDER